MKQKKLRPVKFIVSILALAGMLIFFTNAGAQFSQLNNFKFKTYTTKDGLADNTILKMVKDKRGFLWIATHNGISRFDGFHFKNYTHQPGDTTSLRSIWVTDLIIDNNKTLWASTEGGLCYYDEKFDRFRYINTPHEIQLIYKGPLCMGSDKSIWIASENGLKKVNIHTKKFEPTSLNRIADPQSIIADDNGNILIGTRGFGFFLYNIKTSTTKELSFNGLPRNEHVMSFYKDEEGIWAATGIGLLLIKDEQHSQVYTSGGGALTGKKFEQFMCVNNFEPLTGKNKLLCGSYDKNFLLFDKVEKKFTYRWENETKNAENLPAGVFYSLYAEDKIFWVGTDYGLCKLNITEQDFFTTIIPGLGINNTLSLVKNIIPSKKNNQYWMTIGHPYGGLILYDVQQKKIIKEIHTIHTTQSKKPGRHYINMLAAKSGNLCVQADSLVDIFSQSGDAIHSFKLTFQTYCMDEDPLGNLWIGTENGLLFLDSKTGKQEIYNCTFKGTEVENSSFSQAFRCTGVLYNSDTLIWLTSIKYGLFSFNIISKVFTPYRQPFDGSYETLNRCSALLPDGNNIWVSNMSGITCFDTNKNTFTNYNSTNGLQSTYVYDMDADANGFIWGRGNAGVFSYNPQTKQFVNYSMPLGFLGSLIYQRISALGNGIAVGFEGGYSVFSPLNNREHVLPKAMITDCKLLNNNFYFDKDSIAIAPALFSFKENTIQFQFTAIQFDYPEDLSLLYMLENIDKKWIPANGNNTVSYANLPDGNFTFKVIANSRIGLKQETPAIFRFSIKPPFWRLWWFQLLTITTIAGIVIILFRRRVQRIRQNEAHKTSVNKTVAELEMKTLRSRMNPHFIFNSLNSIQKFIWENKKDDASDYLSKFAKLIRLILDHSSHSFITLSEELEALKIYIELEHRRCNGRFEYAITIAESIDPNTIKVPPLILQPFVENAIWHGLSPLQNKNGVLSVTVKQVSDSLICEVYDNGIGRVKAAELKAQSSLKKTSVGVDITRQRLEQLDDTKKSKTFIETIDLYTAKESAGTKVIIYIPDIKE